MRAGLKEVFEKEHPPLAELWPQGADHNHLYGRPLAFYQQLQNLNLAAAWSQVKVPTLVLHGQYDWIMSREDHELIAAYVNANRPGAARFVEVPETGHTFQHYLSFADAIKRLKDRQVPFAGEPFETPCCHMAVIQDPDGNKLMFHKLKPENEKGVCL